MPIAPPAVADRSCPPVPLGSVADPAERTQGSRRRLAERLRDHRESLVTWGRWRSRNAKASIVRSHIERWGGVESVILVGCGAGWTPLDLVVEEAAADGAERVVAVDLHDKHQIPWSYVKADGRQLPFPSRSFDLALSNAALEHVGDEADQRRFVDEQLRVARHVILTTPNRWFPLETHTRALLKHYSGSWRARQQHEFTRLLSRRELRALLPAHARIIGRPWNSTLTAIVSTS